MDIVQLVLASAVVFMALAIMFLLLQRSDLRRDLDRSREETERWRAEAVRRGWKNPFEECLDALNDSVAQLQTSAQAMSRAAEIQKQNSAKLGEIDRAVRATNEGLRRQNAALETAAGHLDRSSRLLSRPAEAPPVRTPDASVQAVLNRVEADLAAGRVERDPKKLN